MTTLLLIILVLAVWTPLALAVGVIAGRAIRRADMREGLSDDAQDTHTHDAGDHEGN